MNDELLNIKLTEAEINMIMDVLHIVAQTGGDARGHDIAELRDLEHDLMEQVARHDDDWNANEPTDLTGHTVRVTEGDFVQAGIDAREQAKANSRAAMRRNERLAQGTATPCISDFMNDPVDW